jgi:hypothetical protein
MGLICSFDLQAHAVPLVMRKPGGHGGACGESDKETLTHSHFQGKEWTNNK